MYNKTSTALYLAALVSGERKCVDIANFDTNSNATVYTWTW